MKAQLAKAEAHCATSGQSEAALLDARLAVADRMADPASHAPNDLHRYTLGAHIHWAAEGARLAMARLLVETAVPNPNQARSLADLHQHLDATIACLREVAPDALEASLDREIVVQHRAGSVRSSGRQFLIAFAIPHFFYHLSSAYGILRNEGVQLTMGDFLGNWGAA